MHFCPCKCGSIDPSFCSAFGVIVASLCNPASYRLAEYGVNGEREQFKNLERPFVQVKKSRVFVKNATDVFGKADGARFKCPRCKGNGLNSSHQFWDRSQSSDSSELCWFCEGVGVMPLIGLNGFMIGRSKPIISTKNSNPLPKFPMNLQLYLGKFPEAKCKVKTYKPSTKLADLLYDPSQTPYWMYGASGEVRISESSGDSSSSLAETSKQGVTKTGNRATRFQASRKSNSSASRTSPRRGRVIVPTRAGDSLFATARKTVSISLPEVHRDGVLPDSISGTRKSPLLRTPKGSRFPRGGRNRVREEAEKETFFRAYKFRNSPSETRNLAGTDSPESRHTGDEKIDRFVSLSQGGIGLTNSQRRMIMPSKILSSDATTPSQLALGKVKDGLMRTPSLGKAF